MKAQMNPTDPIANYGYLMNPTPFKEGDEVFVNGVWLDAAYPAQTCYARRRRISPGDGYRILGLDEIPPEIGAECIDHADGLWVTFKNWSRFTVRDWLTKQNNHFLAIRVPVEQEKKGGDDNATSALRGITNAPEETNGADISTTQPRFSGEWVECAKELPKKSESLRVITILGIEAVDKWDGTYWASDCVHKCWYRLFPQAPPPVVEKEDECRYQYQVAVRSLEHEVDYDSFKAGWHAAGKAGGE